MKKTVRQLTVLAGAAVLCTLASVRGQEQEPAAAKEKAPAAVKQQESAAAKAVPAVRSDGTYQYFEYQVITVPKKTLVEAAESMGLPRIPSRRMSFCPRSTRPADTA